MKKSWSIIAICWLVVGMAGCEKGSREEGKLPVIVEARVNPGFKPTVVRVVKDLQVRSVRPVILPGGGGVTVLKPVK